MQSQEIPPETALLNSRGLATLPHGMLNVPIAQSARSAKLVDDETSSRIDRQCNGRQACQDSATNFPTHPNPDEVRGAKSQRTRENSQNGTHATPPSVFQAAMVAP